MLRVDVANGALARCRPGVLGADHGGTRRRRPVRCPTEDGRGDRAPPRLRRGGDRPGRARPARARGDAVGAATRVRTRGGEGRGLPEPPASHRPRADDLAALHRRAHDGSATPRTGRPGARGGDRIGLPGGRACSRSRPRFTRSRSSSRSASRRQRRSTRLGIGNVKTRIGDGYAGWPEQAPYDAIIVTAAPEHIPAQLVEQLRPGGRLVIPVGGLDQDLRVVEKKPDGTTISTAIIPVRFVPLTRERRKPD